VFVSASFSQKKCISCPIAINKDQAIVMPRNTKNADALLLTTPSDMYGSWNIVETSPNSGIFTIISPDNKWFWGFTGAEIKGNNIRLRVGDMSLGIPNQPHRQWRVEKMPNGYCRIQNVNTKTCLQPMANYIVVGSCDTGVWLIPGF